MENNNLPKDNNESSAKKHHHHHHHHYSRKNGFASKIKRSKGIIILSFVLLVGLVVLFELMDFDKIAFEKQHENDPVSDVLVVEMTNREGVLVSDEVSKYLLADISNPANSDLKPSSLGDGKIDAENPVTLKLSVKEGNAVAYKIEIADNSAFSGAEIYYIEDSVASFKFEHLYTNSTYHYRATVYTSTGVDSVVGEFTTADTPRILSVDGISNVRDIGNWSTDSGKKIKQGLLIRGSELDGAATGKNLLTNDGLFDLLNAFGIKTDMDLRLQTAETKDALGALVDHRYYNIPAYEGIFDNAGKEKIKLVFTDLADPANYPVYIHCTDGNDVTGTVCYLLEALLGVSGEDRLKEYGLSDLNLEKIKAMESGLEAYEGNTLEEKAEAYLLSCGVSKYQIETIRNIFLGD